MLEKLIKLKNHLYSQAFLEEAGDIDLLIKKISSDKVDENKRYLSEEENSALKELYYIISKTYEDLKAWAEERGYDTSVNLFRIKIKNEYKPPFDLKKRGWNLILDTKDYKKVFPQLADELEIQFKPDVDGNAELATLGGVVSYIAISSKNFADPIGIKKSIQHELQHIVDFGTIQGDGVEGIISYLTNDGEIKAHAKEAAYYFSKMFPGEKNFDIEKVKEVGNNFKNYYNFLKDPEGIVERKGLDASYLEKIRSAGKSFEEYSQYFLSLFSNKQPE